IGISLALVRRHCRHHRSPTSAMQPAGQDPEGASRARNGHSTALFVAECQSFLDNVIARLGQTGSWNNPHSPAGLTSTAKLNREYECLVRFDSITRVFSPRCGHFPKFSAKSQACDFSRNFTILIASPDGRVSLAIVLMRIKVLPVSLAVEPITNVIGQRAKHAPCST